MYQVPQMRLVPQDRNNACWYAATQMVVRWRRNRKRMTERFLADPSEIPAAVAAHVANNGLPWSKMRLYASMIGLVPAPLMTPSTELLDTWLRSYGPLWTDGVPVDRNGRVVGSGHVVVIAGIKGSGAAAQILIYDPWPPGVGNVSWRPISHFVGILSDGANPQRNVSILHLPVR